MARKLALFLLLTGAAFAQDVPVEVPVVAPYASAPPPPKKKRIETCPGCDCAWADCFTPMCDCRLPVNPEWGQAMLAREREVLELAYPDRLQVRRAIKVKVVDPTFRGKWEHVQGYYGEGVIQLSSILSRRDAAAVLAHEYGHAWQAENHPGWETAESVLVEGFAEWVAYQVMKRLGDYAATDKIKRNVDPVYGRGVRWYLGVEAEKGVGLVWEMATSWMDMRGTRL